MIVSVARDGGPAFPVPAQTLQSDGMLNDAAEVGMSRRDWFAGQALAGWSETHHKLANKVSAYHTVEEMAAFAYRIADAMLAESIKGEE